MTAKDFVKQTYPKAQAERQVTGRAEVYWLIRDGRATMYMATGSTESKAWVEAKKWIIKNQKSESKAV